MSPAIRVDLLLYLVFVIGQWTFILKRAGSAIRNTNSIVTSRREFVYHNWDTILIRALIEAAVVFYPLRYFTIGQIVGFLSLGNWTPSSIALNTVLGNPIAFFAIGYGSDSILDWISLSQKLPAFLRNWLKENVPTYANGTGPK